MARAAALAATLAKTAEEDEEDMVESEAGDESKSTSEEVVDSDKIASQSILKTQDAKVASHTMKERPLSSVPARLSMSPFGLTTLSGGGNSERRPSIVTSTMDDLSKIPLGYLWPELDEVEEEAPVQKKTEEVLS